MNKIIKFNNRSNKSSNFSLQNYNVLIPSSMELRKFVLWMPIYSKPQ